MMEQYFEFINWGFFLGLLFVGFLAGKIAETLHFKSIEKREVEFDNIKVFTVKKIPEIALGVDQPFVSGMVVLSHDYFKGFLANIRRIFGGRIRSYETLVKRAKREAILRLKAQARDQGASAIYNLRLETSSVSKGQRNMVVSVEVFAYGTAIK